MQPLDIEKRIEKLIERPPTFEKYNLLGDLYLLKENRHAATECFYKAASYARRDKAIAVYKKIIKITPEDTRPYNELITIYADLGLVAEEKKYLLLLARTCHVIGDAEGERIALQKVSALDPTDLAAQTFLSSGEIPREVETEYQKHVRTDDSSELVSLMEESIGGSEKQEKEEEERKPGKRLLIPLLLIAALVGVGVGFFAMTAKEKKQDIPGRKPSSVTPKTVESRPLKTVRDGNMQIDVVMLSPDPNNSSFLTSFLDEKTFGKYAFYAVTARAVTGCITHEISQNIPLSFALVSADGRVFQKEDLPQLQAAMKVIYKANICGAERGIVFLQFFQAYPKESVPAGFSFLGKKVLD